MSQVLQGMASVVRVVRSPLGVVAAALLLGFVFALAVFFAPINEIAKYVFAGAALAFVLLVWLQFWAKAKGGPIVATETYHLEQLRYEHMGTDEMPLGMEELRLQVSTANPYLVELTDASDEEVES